MKKKHLQQPAAKISVRCKFQDFSKLCHLDIILLRSNFTRHYKIVGHLPKKSKFAAHTATDDSSADADQSERTEASSEMERANISASSTTLCLVSMAITSGPEA